MIELKSNLLERYLEVCNEAIVIFGSHTCAKCNQLREELKPLDNSDSGYVFLFVDGEKFEDLADEYEIDFYPTVIYFKNGKQIKRIDKVNIKKIKKILK